MCYQTIVASASENQHARTELLNYTLSGDQCSLKLSAHKGA